MASLRKRRGKWYSRTQWWDGKERKEVSTPLNTKSKVTATERLSSVNKVEEEIKELHYKGEKYSFAWQNDEGERKIKYLTLEQAYEMWVKVRQSQGLAQSTIERNRNSMNTFMSIIGKSIRLKSIKTSHIDNYTERMHLKGYAPNGININLRTLVTFFKWASRRNHIDKKPYIDKVKVSNSLPCYFNDMEFEKLMSETNEHFEKVFRMYRNTGFRLTEPILGVLKNDTLIISAEHSKTRKERRILLSPLDVPVIYELQERFNVWRSKVKVNRTKYFAQRYSKEFKRLLNLCELEGKFHDLRHTFAVRRYLITRDIYQVMKELGHTKVTTTQIYTEFEDTIDIALEFPSIVNIQNKVKFGKEDTLLEDTNNILGVYVS